MASHMPKKLQCKALGKLVSTIVSNAFPCSMQLLCTHESIGDASATYLMNKDFEYDRHRDPRFLDLMLMSTEEREPEFLPHKKALLERLHQISSWFNENEWLGGENNDIRRQVRNAISHKLQMIDPYYFIPLFKFLLELLFASEVGGCSDAAQYPFIPRINCELWRKDCPLFADLVRSFAPFHIEELSTHHLTFGDPLPLLVIIKNSRCLKRVYLRNNVCEDMLRALEKNCPLINIFQMDKCLGSLRVEVDCLYKTFFSGMDQKSAIAFAADSSLSDRYKQVSFQNLKSINLGKLDDLNKEKSESMSLFIYLLLYFYPHTINVISDTFYPFSPALPNELPACIKDMSYNVLSCSLNGIQKWVKSRLSKDQSDVGLPLLSVRQLIFLQTPYESNDGDTQELVEFSKCWIPKLGCKALFLYILQEPDYEIDMAPLYEPLFSTVGSMLSAFHLNIVGDIELVAVCNIISNCPNLEFLRLKVAKVHATREKDLNIEKMTKLTSVIVHSTENHAPLVRKFIEKLIDSSPELDALSLVMHDKPYSWLMFLASSKKLNNISILRLSFHCFNFSIREVSDFFNEDTVGASFYVFLIELLPSLKMLQLGSLPHHLLVHMQLIYRKSDLQIDVWHVPCHSKDWFGGSSF